MHAMARCRYHLVALLHLVVHVVCSQEPMCDLHMLEVLQMCELSVTLFNTTVTGAR